jgi:MFS superfamily sulfate permease-like transporter
VVFLIGIELIAVRSMKQIYRLRIDEFIVAAITALVVVVVGVEQGILLAIVLSILDHLRFSYTPNDAVMVRDADGSWNERPLADAAQAVPGLADLPLRRQPPLRKREPVRRPGAHAVAGRCR